MILVGGSTRIPAVRALVKELYGEGPEQSVNPDEVVALGAAVQAGVLGGEVKDIVLLDVTPLSLGIETARRRHDEAHQRNTTYPDEEVRGLLHRGGQPAAVEIKVLQGEREIAKDNKILGKFAPRRDPARAARRAADRGHVRHRRERHSPCPPRTRARARRRTSRSPAASTLSEDEVEKMVKDAEAFAERGRGEARRGGHEELRGLHGVPDREAARRVWRQASGGGQGEGQGEGRGAQGGDRGGQPRGHEDEAGGAADGGDGDGPVDVPGGRGWRASSAGRRRRGPGRAAPAGRRRPGRRHRRRVLLRQVNASVIVSSSVDGGGTDAQHASRVNDLRIRIYKRLKQTKTLCRVSR